MRFRALLLALLLPVLLQAQTVISVDSNISRNSGKSVLLAVGASALLPGMGELYLGETDMVRPFVWVDASLWVVALSSYVIGDRYLTSAHGYAVRHAGLNSNSKSSTLLNAVGDYRSRAGIAGQNTSPDDDEDYNQAMIRAGKDIDADLREDIVWDWGTSDNPETTKRMKHYKDLLSDYRVSRIVFQVAVGALVVNRVASMLDAMRVYRATSSKGLASRIEMNPYVGFADGVSGVDFLLNF